MNHEDNERELFKRLEAEVFADSPAEESGDVVDFDKARTTRSDTNGSADGPGVESDDDDADRPRPVDGPQPKDPGLMGQAREAGRRELVPSWLKTRAELGTAVRWLAAYVGHIVAFHALRSPVYAGRLLRHTPRGIGRSLRGWRRWASDAEGAGLRSAEAFREHTGEYLKLSRQRDRRVRWRGAVTVVMLPILTTVALLLAFAAPWWIQTLAIATAVGVFGVVGAPADAPISQHAVVKTEAPKLTASMVTIALGALGNAELNAAIKKGAGLRFTSEIHRDGPGWRADIELPPGVTPDDVIDKRKELASGLRRKLGCVWPMPNPDDHEGTVILWVGDRPMHEAKAPVWPLAKSGTVDLFKPVPFANNQQMRWVNVSLMFVACVIGSIPRMGKTFLMRLLLLIAALDPRAELHAYDFKGTGDFRPLKPVCHRYRSGEEDEDIKYCLDDLRELKTELRRRAKVINSLPLSRCPESKVTSELASDKRLRLHPVMVVMDECQKAFEHDKYGKEIQEIVTDFVKRGPALGFITVLATQRVDKHSIPTPISANAVLRFCLKVTGQMENDMILGTSMYKAGYRATIFSFKRDKGMAWMSGEEDEPTIIRGTKVDAPMADTIVARARKLREDYGNVTGIAADEDLTADAAAGYDLLADIRTVTTAEEERIWNERIAARLAELRPEVYGGWKTENVTTALKPYGVKTTGVAGTTDAGERTTRRGIVRAHILKAIAERDDKRDAA
ncbi:FtsK/SpoIIIE domain-containing protein [Streptomyces aculeolatus]|uniref:cell division protein FtsK n=1 Tax=Streptomyces aculeolatus TaxID=270689 RepID=UPI001CEC824B|nr:cell division protein FtsK [Streptomyces aculeolatus]